MKTLSILLLLTAIVDLTAYVMSGVEWMLIPAIIATAFSGLWWAASKPEGGV